MKGKGMKSSGKAKMSAMEKADKKEDKKDCYATGGAVRKAHGVSAKSRLDKKSRKVATPGSPLSGAAPKSIGGRNTGENN